MSHSSICILQLDGGAKAPHTEGSVQGLSERSVNLVKKLHVVAGHTIICQGASNVIQVDSDAGRARSGELCAFVIVHERRFGIRAVQAPGLGVPAKTAFIIIAFAADSLVCYGNVYLCALPVHFPVRSR